MVFCFRQFLFVMFLLFVIYTQASAQQIKIGWLEKVTINNAEIPIPAKIDTGADNSSINANKAEIYSKQGNQWVKFTIKNKADREIIIDKPIVRTTRIKMKDESSQRRFIIELDICLGSVRKRTLVNLTDRSHFEYQVLIGRSFLSPDYLVDASKVYLTKPQCE